MEFLFVLAVFLLAGAGISLGVFFGRGPAQGSCGGSSCIKDYDCEACPNRHAEHRA